MGERRAESAELAEQVELVPGSGMHTNSLTSFTGTVVFLERAFHSCEPGGKSETDLQPAVVQPESLSSLQMFLEIRMGAKRGLSFLIAVHICPRGTAI